jgi:glycine/D-amino acid oxidase-like deaminating enzyme
VWGRATPAGAPPSYGGESTAIRPDGYPRRVAQRPPLPDVVVIGGGIVGTSAAALLAEAGVAVTLVERSAIAAGASGRNSGSIQHPLDEPLAELHRRTLALYGELAAQDAGSDAHRDAGEPAFAIPAAPAGLLLVAGDPAALADDIAAMERPAGARWAAELRPELLEPAELARVEPALAPGIWALRLETGYPVVPATATLAFARRARRAGAVVRIGEAARPRLEAGRVNGVELDSGASLGARQVLVAAGPWSPALVPGWHERPPIGELWGVVVGVDLADPPHAILEEAGIDALGQPPAAFSLITAGGVSSVGSTFEPARPEPSSLTGAILERATRFVPGLAGARVGSVRACARPVAFDGRPLVGAVTDVDGLFICAGHGPWGLSAGPASAEAIVDEMLGRPARPTPATRAALSAARWDDDA